MNIDIDSCYFASIRTPTFRFNLFESITTQLIAFPTENTCYPMLNFSHRLFVDSSVSVTRTCYATKSITTTSPTTASTAFSTSMSKAVAWKIRIDNASTILISQDPYPNINHWWSNTFYFQSSHWFHWTSTILKTLPAPISTHIFVSL